MGLGPDVWGPHGWKFFHFVALGYPKNPTNDDKENYKTFFSIIPNILPCSICSNHYKKNLGKYPLTDEVLSDRISLLNWTIDMHNEVNKINGKKVIDYETGLNLVMNNYMSDKINNHQISHVNNFMSETSKYKIKKPTIVKKVCYKKYIFIFILIILVILGLYYKKYI